MRGLHLALSSLLSLFQMWAVQDQVSRLGLANQVVVLRDYFCFMIPDYYLPAMLGPNFSSPSHFYGFIQCIHSYHKKCIMGGVVQTHGTLIVCSVTFYSLCVC